MKILVVYYSRSHTTEKVAKQIARDLGGDFLRVNSELYPMGIFGYIRAAIHSVRQKQTPIEFVGLNIDKYELVVVGSPVWASNMSAPIRSFLNQYSPKIKNLAYFVTCGGAGAENTLQQMVVNGKQNPIATMKVTSEDFLKGSYERNLEAFENKIRTFQSKMTRNPEPLQHLAH